VNKDTIEYIKIFVEYEEEITWVLRQQEKLRLEYIMFLKKDLPEILNRQKIKRYPWNKDVYERTVKEIIDDYSQKISSSIDILSSDLVNKISSKNDI